MPKSEVGGTDVMLGEFSLGAMIRKSECAYQSYKCSNRVLFYFIF